MSFNLIDKPWIPCKFISGKTSLISLQELFKNAGRIEDLNSDNPLVNGSLYRLLIAIIHRAINGPEDATVWRYLWEHDSFPQDNLNSINSYLQKWHERFYVFHEKYPFYQVPDLDETAATTIAILAPQLASRANATLFNHCHDDLLMKISIDQAIRWIIAIQNYSLGGLNTPYDSARLKDTRRNNKSAMGSPLAQAALVIITGKTLYKTLLLNLHWYNTQKNIPYEFSGDDKPVWERDDYTLPYERLPQGLVDWYTYQSRAVKLIPNNNEIDVVKAILMVGERIPQTQHRKYFETMLAFKETSGKDPFPAINFSEQKALWRDFNALMQLIEGSYRPRTMNWISDLVFDNYLEMDYFPLQLFGACSNQASFIQFRYESLPFNPQRLHEDKFITNINEYLKYVERVGDSLWKATRMFFIIRIPDIYQMLKSISNTDDFFQVQTSKIITDFWEKLKQKKKDRIKQKIRDSNILSNYWNRAGIYFNQFLLQNLEDPDTIIFSDWVEKNKKVGSYILRDHISSNNLDAQALKAGTIAIKTYFKRLKND